jgi:hypothetical protein
MMASITDIERLNYYEGEFLGATDFQTEQEYHRDMRRRHNVGQHSWGIVSGLDLVLIPNGATAANGPAVDIYLQPGMAVDAFGREIVVLNKTQVTQDLFAPYVDVNNPGALTMYLWISFAQLQLQPPTDPCTALNQPNAYGRVQEAFALTATKDPNGPTNEAIVVDAKSLPLPTPLQPGDIVFPADDSIPYQEFSSDDSTVHWYIPLGQVSWDPKTGFFENQPGLALLGRLYSGNVASAILSPDDSLKIRDRFAPYPLPTDPTDKTVGQFYGGVAVQLAGSLSIDRLLEARQSVLIDGAPDASNKNLSPLNINASSADQSLVQFRDSSGTPLWSIWETPPATNPPGLNFGETDNTGKPAASDLFIQKGGNIGVGTSSPTQNLSLNGGLNIDQGKQNNGTNLSPGLSFGTAAREGIASNQTGGGPNAAGLDLYAAGSARLSVFTDGKVAIGTPSPTHQLEVVDARNTGLRVQTNTAGGTVASFGGFGEFQIDAPGVVGGRLVVKENGSVGIGTTTTPQQNLSVNAGLNIDQANQNPGLVVAPGLTFGSGSGEGIASTRKFGGTNLYGLDFYTDFLPRLSISNNGSITTAGQLTVGTAFTVNGSRTYLIGQDGALNHWIMGGGTVETINNALALSFNSATQKGSITVAGNWTLVAAQKVGYLADRFLNRSAHKLERGDVVVLHGNPGPHYYGSDGRIPLPEVEVTTRECDTRVCGIVDDAVANPSVVQDLDLTQLKGASVGIMVTSGAYAHCKADADGAAISPGDLLTTSSTPGYAQRLPAGETVRPGSIIGKALGHLKKGKGLIPVLVSHQ